MITYEELEKSYNYLSKNLSSMNAELDIHVTEGVFDVKVKKIDEAYKRYVKTLEDLSSRVAKDSYTVAFNILCKVRYPSEEDFESEEKKGREFLLSHIEELLQNLFSDGLEKFVSIVSAQSVLNECAYRMSHIEYTEGGWKDADGHVLNDGCWVTPAGVIYSDMTASVVSSIVA